MLALANFVLGLTGLAFLALALGLFSFRRTKGGKIYAAFSAVVGVALLVATSYFDSGLT